MARFLHTADWQVATAFRLATAEILAAEFGRTLPPVFDDSFVNSDPQRVDGLMRTLDLAQRRGLQIILMTCDPEGYRGLGAKEVLL